MKPRLDRALRAWRRPALAGLAAALAGLSGGCGILHRRAPAPPPQVILEPPILLQAPPASEPPMAPPAVMSPLTAPAAATVAAWAQPTLSLAPPRPPVRRASEGGGASREDRPAAPALDEHPAPAPQLTTSLTPQQQAAYRRTTQAILNRTLPALRTLNERHNLSSDAAATRAQAGEYVRQAQDALTQGDLVRAQTLAEKAETLARFLLNQ